MNLNIIYDEKTKANAPSVFFGAVNYVVNLFYATFRTNATLNIEVGYGDFPLDNSVVQPLGESEQASVQVVSYDAVRQQLSAVGAPGAAALPAAEPLGGSLVVGSAQAKALGLSGPSSAVDGYVGVASDATLQSTLGDSWSFDPAAKPAANQFYLVGVLEHEFTEIMGRASYLDVPGEYGIIDLYLEQRPDGAGRSRRLGAQCRTERHLQIRRGRRISQQHAAGPG